MKVCFSWYTSCWKWLFTISISKSARNSGGGKVSIQSEPVAPQGGVAPLTKSCMRFTNQNVICWVKAKFCLYIIARFGIILFNHNTKSKMRLNLNQISISNQSNTDLGDSIVASNSMDLDSQFYGVHISRSEPEW